MGAAEELVQHIAATVEPLASRHLPVALALLAALLATLLVVRSRSGGGAAVQSTQKKQKRIFTAAEVAKHTQEDDVWIILNGRVYDVTPYVEEHPGGKAILRNAGGDSTKGFHGPQHPDRVFDLIEDFYIGDLEPAASK